MRTIRRRSLLSALGIVLPFGLTSRLHAASSATPAGVAPTLRLVSFEDAVRAAFATPTDSLCRRVLVGDSDLVRAGVQGCHNDRPFAGFPAGQLRVVRAGSEAGPSVQGVRLHVSTVDIALTDGLPPGNASRPLDFASLPPAPVFA